MPWTIDFKQDGAKDGIGTVTIVYVGADAGQDAGISFSMFSELNTTNDESINSFLTEAIAVLEAHRARKTKKNLVIEKLTTLLNAKTQ